MHLVLSELRNNVSDLCYAAPWELNILGKHWINNYGLTLWGIISKRITDIIITLNESKHSFPSTYYQTISDINCKKTAKRITNNLSRNLNPSYFGRKLYFYY